MGRSQRKSESLLRFRLDTFFIALTLLSIFLATPVNSGFVALVASILVGAWIGSRTAGRAVGYVAGLVTALYFQFSVVWFFSVSGLDLLESAVFRVLAVIAALAGGFVGGLTVTRPIESRRELPREK